MGFFDKIKKNLNHGDIKVHLEAANPIRLSDAELPVRIVVLSTSEQPVQINGLNVRFYYDQTSNDDTSHVQNDVLNIQAPDASFNLQPAESRTFDILLPLHAEKVAEMAGANAAISLFAKAIDVGSTMSQLVNGANRQRCSRYGGGGRVSQHRRWRSAGRNGRGRARRARQQANGVWPDLLIKPVRLGLVDRRPPQHSQRALRP